MLLYSLSRFSKSIDCNLTYVFPLFARSPRRFCSLLPPSTVCQCLWAQTINVVKPHSLTYRRMTTHIYLVAWKNLLNNTAIVWNDSNAISSRRKSIKKYFQFSLSDCQKFDEKWEKFFTSLDLDECMLRLNDSTSALSFLQINYISTWSIRHKTSALHSKSVSCYWNVLLAKK